MILCIALAKRFYPDESAAEVEYTQFASRLCLMVLTPEQITGKMGLNSCSGRSRRNECLDDYRRRPCPCLIQR